MKSNHDNTKLPLFVLGRLRGYRPPLGIMPPIQERYQQSQKNSVSDTATKDSFVFAFGSDTSPISIEKGMRMDYVVRFTSSNRRQALIPSWSLSAYVKDGWITLSDSHHQTEGKR
eukprot:scaffold77_cov163-Alexandrium_tamarense.AAC.3